MNTRIVLFITLILCPTLLANTYIYPKEKRPSVSLHDACKIADNLFSKLELKGYYVLSASLLGDENQTGAGCWNIDFANSDGTTVKIGVSFPDDRCVFMGATKGSDYKEVEYSRDGEVSRQWLEWKTKMEKEKKASDEFWDSLSREE